MKWIVFFLFAALYGVASAQPGPNRPPGPPGPPDRFEQFDPPRPLTCWEWRRDARRHPCVRAYVPRRCRGF